MKSDSGALNEVYPENQKDFFPALLFFLAVIGQNIGVFYLMKRWISLSEVSMLLFIIVYLARVLHLRNVTLGFTCSLTRLIF